MKLINKIGMAMVFIPIILLVVVGMIVMYLEGKLGEFMFLIIYFGIISLGVYLAYK